MLFFHASLYLIFPDIVVIADRFCLISADAVVVVVTIYHTYGTMKMSWEANVQASFSKLLLQAGQTILMYSTYLSTLMIIDARDCLFWVRVIVR